MLIEALHLGEPFALGDQRLGANDENGGDVHPRPKLLDDQPGLDGLADPDRVGD